MFILKQKGHLPRFCRERKETKNRVWEREIYKIEKKNYKGRCDKDDSEELKAQLRDNCWNEVCSIILSEKIIGICFDGIQCVRWNVLMNILSWFISVTDALYNFCSGDNDITFIIYYDRKFENLEGGLSYVGGKFIILTPLLMSIW